MSDRISPELFYHLVKLAALELDAEEAEYLRVELNKQLGVIDELAAIPLDDETPFTSHGVPYADSIRPNLRGDEWVACDNSEEILSQAPEIDENFIVVPDIPHEKLE